MSAACRAWVVAANIGAVEAIKDQGICRCNGVLRSVHQHDKNNIRSQAKTLISDSLGDFYDDAETTGGEVEKSHGIELLGS